MNRKQAHLMAKNLHNDLKAVTTPSVHPHLMEAYKALLEASKEICKDNPVVQAIPGPDPHMHPSQLAVLAGQLEAALREE